MALKTSKDDTHYTLWTHVENGKILTRRLHRMEIQARNGQMYIVKGDSLPDFIQTCAGEGHKGEHVAQILLNPEKLKTRTPYTAPVAKPFPTLRDLACAAVGVICLFALRFVVSVLTGFP